ncbi:MAG: RecT protein [Frankiales bacterium]|nr:RecT protein [Frankiales bacterium]
MTSASTAIEKQAQQPTAIVEQYRTDFAQLLPSHVKLDTWMRVATGALRRDADLAAAARNDPASMMVALLHAARLGLEPGTEEYYLTPRKEKGQAKVLGIVGYQGLVELMYRAGAVSSVVAEVVRTKDKFTYAPGREDRPVHEIDWDLDDRGDLRLVYAYAVMKDGATSKVVVMNRADIERIKKSSAGADSSYSPWQQHEAAMWLKSAARQLAKWTPTSAEYRREGLRAVAEIQRDTAAPPPRLSDALPPVPEGVDDSTGEIVDGEVVEWPAVTEPPADGA